MEKKDVDSEIHNIDNFANEFLHRRIKIELVSSLLNLPFIALLIFLLYSNQEYWDLFNGVLNGILGIEFNWILLLLVILFTMGSLNILIFIIGNIRIKFIHIGEKFPYILLIPPICLSLLFITILVVVSVEERVSLDYIFNQLGSAASIIFAILTLGTYLVSILIFYGFTVLWKMNSDLEKSDDRLHVHPKSSALLGFYTTILAIGILFWIASYYSPVLSFWSAYEMLLQYFIPWTGYGLFIWYTGVSSTIIYQTHKFLRKTPNILSNTKILIIVISIQIVSIFLAPFNISSLFGTSGPRLWPYFTIIQIIVLSITILPNIILYYKSHLEMRFKRFKNQNLTKVLLIAGIFLLPFGFYYWLPVIAPIPSADLVFNERIVQLNGINVPFQGDIAYPSFETQMTSELSENDGRRYSLNLSGEWKWLFKSNEYPDYNILRRTDSLLEKLTRDGENLPEFDDSQWEIIDVPRSNCYPYWQGEIDEPKYGEFWYRKIIEVPDNFKEHQLILKFFGGGYIMDLWINGSYVGYHEITYYGSVFDVSDFLTPNKSSVIAIRVIDTNFDADSSSDIKNKHIPAKGDNFVYGGLTREIWLEALPLASISRTDVKMIEYQTVNHQNGEVELQVDTVIRCPSYGILKDSVVQLDLNFYPLIFQNNWIFNSESQFQDWMNTNLSNFRNTWEYANFSEPIITTITKNLTLTGVSNTNYTAYRFNFNITNIGLWNTKTPNLYLLMLNMSNHEGLIDTFCIQTGFRDFSTEGKKFMLNGAELKMPGVAFHEEMYDPYGSSVRDWQIIYKLCRVKAVNANFIRMGQYMMHPNWYLFAERMGFVMWAEAPLVWLNEIHFTSLYTRSALEPIWIQLVYPNINRPGILFWGGPNEPWAGSDYERFLSDSVDYLNEIDGTRIFSWAAVLIPQYYQAWKNDPELLVLSPNNYAGTFTGIRGDYYNEVHKSMDEFEQSLGEENLDRPVIIMEYGYWHEDWKGDEKYDNQLKCLNESVTAYLERDITSFTWFTVFDYIGFKEGSWYNSGFGVYSLDGWEYYEPIGELMKNIYGNITITNL